MNFAVVMAGGRGKRLWPLSTSSRPKQFLNLAGQRTMIQETVSRISPLFQRENIYVVTPVEYRELALEQLDIPEENIIVEPLGRNTAPCVGLAAVLLAGRDPQGVMAVLPADHVIEKKERFNKLLMEAMAAAQAGAHLVTLGIVPHRPATGYGYIQRGKLFEERDGVGIYRVGSFTEKPDERTAKQFLESGEYYWNSGMFVWRVDTILGEMEAHMPRLYEGLEDIKAHLGTTELNKVIKKVYEAQESISVDNGVLERSSKVLVVPAEIGWNDIGDWAALDGVFEQDEQGNIVQGKHLGIDTKNSTIYGGSDKLIATIGLEDIVIVETDKALLVMDKARAQQVQELASRLEEKGSGGRVNQLEP